MGAEEWKLGFLQTWAATAGLRSRRGLIRVGLWKGLGGSCSGQGMSGAVQEPVGAGSWQGGGFGCLEEPRHDW